MSKAVANLARAIQSVPPKSQVRVAAALKEGFWKNGSGEIIYLPAIDLRKEFASASADYEKELKQYNKDLEAWEKGPKAEYEKNYDLYLKRREELDQLPYSEKYEKLPNGQYKHERVPYPEFPYNSKPNEPLLPEKKWTKVIIHVDMANRRVHYVDEDNVQKVQVLTGYRPLTDADIAEGLSYNMPRSIVNSIPLETIIKEWSNSSLDESEKPYYTSYKDGDKQYDPNEVPYWAYGVSPAVRKAVDEAAEEKTKRAKDPFAFSSYSRLTLGHILSEEFSLPLLAQQYADDFDEISDRVEKRKEEYLNATADDCPYIPNLKKGMEFFPHQALALAILDKNPTAIIDVSMGGGKTALIMADALNMIMKGKCKRPLIVMPNACIPQNKAEMEAFTGNRLNVCVINSDTVARLGGGDVEAAFKWYEGFADGDDDRVAAPPNTIYVTSYDWIKKTQRVETGETNSKGKAQTDIICPHAQWLVDRLKIDYVALDESHKIKNSSSVTSVATMTLATVPIKRIASGTIIPNNPIDLLQQARFLDPSMFGTEKDFIDEYAEQVGRGGKVMKWKDGALKAIRKRMQEAGAISIRRTHWLHMLPTRKERIHFVTLTKAQQAVYEQMIHDVMEELMKDPDLAAKWAEAVDEGSEGFSLQILAKLTKVDSLLCACGDVSPILAKTGPADYVSPKVHKINEILKEHFNGPQETYEQYTARVKAQKGTPKDEEYWQEKIAGPGKVLVFVQNIVSAKHIVDNLSGEFSGAALFYSAGEARSNLERFKTDPEVKILVAVDDSLKEGHNLQLANRIIRADVHWNPGDMEQSYARSWRPKQERVVYIDVILADNTYDIAKFARVVGKYHVQHKIDSDFDDEHELKLISMHPNVIFNFRKKDLLDPYVERLDEIAKQERTESDLLRNKYGSKMFSRRLEGVIKGSALVQTPTYNKQGASVEAPVYTLYYEKRVKNGKAQLVISDADSVNVFEVAVANRLKFRWDSKSEDYVMAWPSDLEKLKSDALDNGYRLRPIDKKPNETEFEIDGDGTIDVTETVKKRKKEQEEVTTPAVLKPKPLKPKPEVDNSDAEAQKIILAAIKLLLGGKYKVNAAINGGIHSGGKLTEEFVLGNAYYFDMKTKKIGSKEVKHEDMSTDFLKAVIDYLVDRGSLELIEAKKTIQPTTPDKAKRTEFTKADIRITYFGEGPTHSTPLVSSKVFVLVSGKTFPAKEVIKSFKTKRGNKFIWVGNSNCWQLTAEMPFGDVITEAKQIAEAFEQTLKNDAATSHMTVAVSQVSPTDPLGQMIMNSSPSTMTQNKSKAEIDMNLTQTELMKLVGGTNQYFMALKLTGGQYEVQGAPHLTNEMVAVLLLSKAERFKATAVGYSRRDPELSFRDLTSGQIESMFSALIDAGEFFKKMQKQVQQESVSLPEVPADSDDDDNPVPLVKPKVLKPKPTEKKDEIKRLPIWAGLEDRDDVVYLMLDAEDEGAANVASISGLKKRPGYFYIPLDSKQHAAKIINKIKDQLGLVIKNEASVIADVARNRRLSGKKADMTISQRKKEQKPDWTIELHFGSLNGDLHFFVWMTESNAELAKLRKIKFAAQAPFFEFDLKDAAYSRFKGMMKKLESAGVFIDNWFGDGEFAETIESWWPNADPESEYPGLIPAIKPK